jgi:8-oxo-dGTP pyrophosphatase MutT (NUDIX family)
MRAARSWHQRDGPRYHPGPIDPKVNAPAVDDRPPTSPPKPVTPRDAASLVIHREFRGHHEVLMGRRGSRARFKPGVYVFPGGGLERADYRVQPLGDLHHEIPSQMAVGHSLRKANALALAAVREAFEEAGLLFGDAGDVGSVAHNTWQEFRRRQVAPNLGELQFLGRAITPSYQPIRFHARFFSIPFERLNGELGGDGELEDLRWIGLDEIHGLEMMIVQEMIMATLKRRLAGLDAPAQRLFFGWGKRNVVDA